jgi:signal peptidase II
VDHLAGDDASAQDEDQLYEGQPYGDQPYEGQPYEDEPYEDQLYEDQPYENQPYEDEPYEAAGNQDPGLRYWLVMGICAVVMFAADQITKVIALDSLVGGTTVPLVGSLLQLRLVYNPGAAFSMGESLTLLFTALAASVVLGVLWVARRVRSLPWAVALGLLVAGAAGNLVDRLTRPPGIGRGEVIDFIDYGGRFVGNIADVAIVAAMGLIVITVMRGVSLDGERR